MGKAAADTVAVERPIVMLRDSGLILRFVRGLFSFLLG